MNSIRIYNELINNAISQNRIKSKEIYYEKHHIIPRCLGGLDNKDNIALLTAREHFLAHWLLVKIYPENYKLAHAFNSMRYISKYTHQRYINSHLFKYARETFIKFITGKPTWNKGLKTGKPASNRGKKLTNKEKENISIKTKNAMNKPEVKEKQLNAAANRIWITNGIINKRIKIDEYSYWQNKGFIRGLTPSEHRTYNGGKNTIRIHNGKNNKRVKQDELEYWLNNGWIKGGLQKPLSEEHKNKLKGRKIINNGKIEKCVKQDELEYWLSNGYKLGGLKRNHILSEESHLKLSNMNLGRIWINNGIVEKFVKPENLNSYTLNGFVIGRLSRVKK